MMKLVAILLVAISIVGFTRGGYVGAPIAPLYGGHYPYAYGGHYAYTSVPVVKSLSSVAVAHAPLATSYSNTYKFSHPVPVIKPYVKHYYSPYYSYGHGFDYDYPLYVPNYLHK